MVHSFARASPVVVHCIADILQKMFIGENRFADQIHLGPGIRILQDQF